MLVNAILFGIFVAIFWVGIKSLWAKGTMMRVIVLGLSAPIFVFMGMLIMEMAKS